MCLIWISLIRYTKQEDRERIGSLMVIVEDKLHPIFMMQYMVLSMDRVQVYLPWSYKFSPTMMCVGPNLFCQISFRFGYWRFCPSRRCENEMSKKEKKLSVRPFFFFYSWGIDHIYTNYKIKMRVGIILHAVT